jgi:hypothetical protein
LPALLLLILGLGGLAFLLRNAQGPARLATVATIAVLGPALALGCLLVFPSAEIWRSGRRSWGGAGSLMANPNRSIRLAGIEVLRQLLDEEQITQQRAYGILTAYIRGESP